MKRRISLILLLPLLILCGCAAPVEVHRFKPAAGQPNIAVITQANEDHLRYTDPDYPVTAVLFEAKNVYILSLAIANRTPVRVNAKDYSVGLYDGRDLKPLTQFTRNDILSFKLSYQSGKPVKTGEPAVDAALGTIMQVFDPSSRSEIIKSLDKAIDDYFSFRPLFPGETREGILCYHADFRLEYPLTLMVKIREKPIVFKWLPLKKAPPKGR
jgi:hypothetical protein